MMVSRTLPDLPNEVIYQILQHLPPSGVPSLDLVSKRFQTLARQPVLWQQFCRRDFKFWDQRWNVEAICADTAATADWKSIYSERYNIDRSTTHQIDNILSSQTGRIRKSEIIVDLGYDVKDTLVRQLRVSDDAEDVLARRFHSKAVLDHMHHEVALQEWVKVRDGQEVPLERALAAFDLFVIQDYEEGFESVSSRLDRIAQQIRLVERDVDNQSPRHRATAVASFMRHNNFNGVAEEAQYHALPHNFLATALQDDKHQCLPLITVAIFCSVAQRLGLDAQPCNFPFHVHAIIQAPKGQDLDGRLLTQLSESQPMYMDPWNSSEETSREELVVRLKEMQIPSSEFSTLLGASPVADIVRRSARNILNSVKILSQNTRSTIATEQSLLHLDGALYGALWALLMLAGDDSNHGTPMTSQHDRFVSHLVQHLERRFNLDVSLFQEHVLPIIQDRGLHSDIGRAVRQMRTDDLKPKKPKPRLAGEQDHVHYRVGQVFKHKRYHYQAIITGWDKECEAGDLWIAQMGVQNLSNGRHQAFYHAMVEDKSVRYVAEENIEVTTAGDINPALMGIAGQHFKRFDNLSKTFISNIRDEYPDD